MIQPCRVETQGAWCAHDDNPLSSPVDARRNRPLRVRHLSGARVIELQHKKDTLTRTLRPQGIAPELGDQLELRQTGSAHETITVKADLDASDRAELPRHNDTIAELRLPVGTAPDTLAQFDRIVSHA
jgi:hypothetical protein